MRRSSDDEILAVDVLHREEQQAVGLADVVDAADVADARPGARVAHFVVELREARRVVSQVVGQELQRDRLTEPEIVGAVDLAHAAAAEQPDDAVAAVEHVARARTGRD